MTMMLFCSVAMIVGQTQAQPKPPVGVPAGAKFFNGKWYHVYVDELPWNRAKAKCASLGGQLAIVPDEPTWAFIKVLSPSAVFWLGATDEASEGLWTWVDGTSMKYTAWMSSQPDNDGGKENYLATAGEKWRDVSREGQFGPHKVVGYICEWKHR